MTTRANAEPRHAYYCRGCGRDFTSQEAFKRHRIGRRDDGRCKTENEMGATGLELRRVTPDGIEHWGRSKDNTPKEKARLESLGGRKRGARSLRSTPRGVGGVRRRPSQGPSRGQGSS
jgi:hypothetical protein